MEKLDFTQEWDKTFPQSGKVAHSKVTFHNRYGITLAADVYKPKGMPEGKLAAIAVCGPFGAVKEQASGLYAQTMAERGFLTMAFDPSFTGESGGQPRYMASPDINTEDFQAAVDYLSCREDVDAEKIGIIGICGWGGMALNAAALDTRIKATVASTMYDMTRVNANGYFDAEDSEAARYEKKKALNAQRIEDYKNGSYALGGGVVDPLPEDAPFFVKDYHDYYKTSRGYHARSLNSNGGWNVTGTMSFMNQPILRLQQRDPLRRAHHPRREGPLLLLQPGRLRRHDGGQSQPGEQGTAHHPRRGAYRPVRQAGCDPLRSDGGLLPEGHGLRTDTVYR